MWQIYEGIANTARQARRYPVLLTSPGAGVSLADDPEELDRVVRSGLSGVIAAVHRTTWKRHLDRWEKHGVPCISLFDPGEPSRPRWYVDLDNRAVGRQAWEYLSQRGHDRVLCPLERNPTQAAADRVRAFVQAQEQSGHEPFIVKLTGLNEADNRCAAPDQRLIIEAMRQTKATDIFGNSGAVSVISFQALRETGIRVPAECSLIGIDVLETHAAFDQMTQFVCPGVQVGEAAARLLESRHGAAADTPSCILVPPALREGMTVADR